MYGRHVMTPDPDGKQLLEFVMTHRKKNRFPFCSFLFVSLDNGAGLDDVLGSLALVLGEVLAEELAQLDNLGVEAVLAGGPSLGGVEKLGGDVGTGLGDLEVEDTVVLVLNIGELTGVDGVENSTGVLEGASLAALSETGTDPTGVEEPGVGLVGLDLVGKHLGVLHGVQSKEGLSEAAGESSLGLGDAVLSTGHLGGVTRDEVEHSLVAVELGDGRQDTAGVACEEDDVGGRVGGEARNLGVGDVLNGVSASSVLSKGRVVVVNLTGKRVEDNVLKDGTVSDSAVDIGLLLSRQTNGLGVATALNVENTGVGPAVLVVSDKSSVGVGGEGGLASSRETEEESDVAVLTLVGGGVEGEDVVLDRHLVEENSEDTLLHLTSVLSTEDDHLLLLKVDGN